ncbi:hypothetical protein [Xanthomonas floridensis]|uniref:Uncharacterized protein n=1 Tax=Xanthomonas floridensis TaxID=1843580 RepID=A0A1A9M7Y9_9XANT|nr:hypothetical protein [Xanthomonas floridensis]MEA5122971.1 hypothetical protein [Xanthomonas floridensis]MEA5130613.1 hypothetical protein [Xanthomonas floridensis]OAG66016.1 hypothetical protein A7D17_06070 [Xanthomonas floridensis]
MLKISMRGTTLAFLPIVPFGAIGSTTAQQSLIRGMGERLPAGKANVSLSPLFKVYVFEKAGLKFVQINSVKDDVLTLLSVAPGAAAQLPIGPGAQQEIVIAKDENAQASGLATIQATCPCSAQVVYRDANYSIVGVYGTNGEYITSHMVPTTPQAN